MTLGRLLYNIYYKPRAKFNQIKKYGLLNYFKIEISRNKMANYSYRLNEIHRPNAPLYTVYFLTGQKYWYQTAFCLYSLQKAISFAQVNAVFIDDGSMNDALIKQINIQFPGCIIKTGKEIEILIDEYLPVSRYPLINKKRTVYPHIRKLTDIHAGAHGWKMVLDSDMLFFKNPTEIKDWLSNPLQPFFLYDPQSSYHYSLNLMEKLSGSNIINNLNVGAIGLNSEAINWDELERWISVMEEKEGSSYYLEQALSSMIVAGQDIIIASRKNYIVMPDKNEVKNPKAILHHYVDTSKEYYFKEAWRKII